MVAGVGVVMLAVSACADSAPGGEGSNGGTGKPAASAPAPGELTERSRPSDSGVAPAIEPGPLPGAARLQEGDELPGEQIDASALPGNYPRKVNVAGTGQDLHVVARERGCGQAGAELVEQTVKRVTVLVVETKPAGSAQRECRSGLRFPTVSVQLDEPLGNRTVELRAVVREE